MSAFGVVKPYLILFRTKILRKTDTTKEQRTHHEFSSINEGVYNGLINIESEQPIDQRDR